MPRPQVVQRLKRVALNAVDRVAADTTAEEVLSTYLSLAHDAVRVSAQLGCQDQVRQALHLMLMLCASDTVH